MLICCDGVGCMPAQLFRHASGAGGGLLQAVGCLLAGLAGGNQSQTWVGCMVWGATATNSSLNCSKSTSWRKVALKASNVLAASYLRRQKARATSRLHASVAGRERATVTRVRA